MQMMKKGRQAKLAKFEEVKGSWIEGAFSMPQHINLNMYK